MIQRHGTRFISSENQARASEGPVGDLSRGICLPPTRAPANGPSHCKRSAYEIRTRERQWTNPSLSAGTCQHFSGKALMRSGDPMLQPEGIPTTIGRRSAPRCSSRRCRASQSPAKPTRKALQKTHQDCRSNQGASPGPPTALCLTRMLRQVWFKLSPFWRL